MQNAVTMIVRECFSLSPFYWILKLGVSNGEATVPLSLCMLYFDPFHLSSRNGRSQPRRLSGDVVS